MMNQHRICKWILYNQAKELILTHMISSAPQEVHGNKEMKFDTKLYIK